MNELGNGELLLSKANKKNTLVILMYILIFILLGALTFLFFISFMPIVGYSMENTVYDGQYCIIQRNGYSISRGDIVIINAADSGEEDHILIKRVIATGGDRLIFMRSSDGRTVDLYLCKSGAHYFSLCSEPYIKEPMKVSVDYHNVTVSDYISTITEINLDDNQTEENAETLKKINESTISVPSKHFFFLGDNRNNSLDARYYGPLNRNHIIGKVLYIPDTGSRLESFFKLIFGY